MTVTDIAKKMQRSNVCINRWVKYCDMIRNGSISKAYIGQPLMPRYIRINGIKYWGEEDLEDIVKFAKAVKRGSMAHFNIRYWKEETANRIEQKKESQRQKEYEEIKRFRELPKYQQEEIRRNERIKVLKKKARKVK